MKKITHTVADLITTTFLIVDLFCGAGGTTTGFAMTEGIAKVIACVNHDKNAIISHWQNHPEVKHFEEDIRTLDLTELIQLVKNNRILFPNAKVILWASLECTNFSKAKGGKARDADSRTLADHLHRYIVGLDPEIVQIENVVEFMSWGPLDKKGKPISSKNGKEWIRWRQEIKNHGYFDEWRQLNAADFGAYTSRNRLFGMFAKKQEWITWPEQTHFKNPGKGGLFAEGAKWKPVKEVLDFEDEGNSIFGRKKDLSDKTLERIYAGLMKYVALGDSAFIAKYYSGRPAGKVISVNGPAGTIRTIDGQSLIQSNFILKYNSTNKNGKHIPPSVDAPCPVIATQNRLGLATANFLTQYNGKSKCMSVDEPANTIPTRDRFAKIHTIWLDKQYTGSRNHQSINQPAGSILANDKHCMMRASWIDRNFSGGGQHQSINGPAGSILSVPKMNLVQPQFLTNMQYANKGTSMDSPAPTILASRRHYYLVNPQWGSKTAQSVDRPCFTLIARMDKAPPSIVITEDGEAAIEVLKSDSEITRKIKMFMAAYGIVDIKMRMLKVPELLKIQGFPDDYKLAGNQTDQKKFIGNSVCPDVVRAWITAIHHHYYKIAA